MSRLNGESFFLRDDDAPSIFGLLKRRSKVIVDPATLILTIMSSIYRSLLRTSLRPRWLTPRSAVSSHKAVRPFSTEEPRESMPFDVLIVGGGPAGLAASIRLKQMCNETGKDLSVCLIDKGR